MPDPFGAFGWICRHTVLPQCNLFFNQLWNEDSEYLDILFPSSSDFYSYYSVSAKDDSNVRFARMDAGVGVGSNCVIPQIGQRSSIGDIALIVIAGLSTIVALLLTFLAGRRKAAVGRVELRLFFMAYAAHSALSVITMSSVLQQGTTALAVLSAIHVGVVVALFWILLGNALVATQIVEDGTLAALVPLVVVAVLFFAPTLYIALDTAFRWTDAFRYLGDDNVRDLRAIALFILTLLWPALAALLYVVIMMYVVLVRLRETKPALLYLGAAFLFVAAQITFFLTSQPLCDASNRKINSAFLATLINTGAVGLMYWAWKVITEETWGEDAYGYYQ